MAIGISYVYKNPNVAGESCPACGRKSWDIFRCNDSGRRLCWLSKCEENEELKTLVEELS